MKAKILAILLLLAFSVPSIQIIPAYAEVPEEIYLDLETEPYVLHGDNVEISVTSEPNTTYSMKIFDPQDLVFYDKNHQTDANGSDTISFMAPLNFSSGTYTIKANISNSVWTTWKSLVNTTNFKPASFPFSRSHNGVNYTIQPKGFQAVSETGNITIDYPSLPIGFSVTAYRNSMCFVERLKNEELGIHIDLSYLFIYAGMKIVINGSIPESATYSFKLDNPWKFKRLMDGIRSGFLVFDWGDLRKTAQAFTYEDGTLTVNVPRNFKVDPYVFEDGFESGFTPWTGVEETGGATCEITQSPVHHGVNASNCTTPRYGTSGTWKDFTATTEIYARAYVNFLVLPPVNQYYKGLFLRGVGNPTQYNLMQMYVRNSDGTVKWGFFYRNGSYVTALSDLVAGPSANTWYCVELYVKCSSADDTYDGEFRMWVDGTELTDIHKTGCDTDNVETFRFRAVFYVDWDTTTSAFFDCCVVDSSYIGPENTAPTIGSFGGPATGYANSYFFVNATVNDSDGSADIKNASIQLNGTIVLSYDNVTDTFSESQDSGNYCTLDSSNSLKTDLNGTAFKISWKIKLYWNYTEGSISVNGTVYDDSEASGSGGPSSTFTFEDDLIIHSVTHEPNEPENGRTFTLTGQIYYYGTATAPEDATGITVKLWKGGFIVGSTASITNGQFTLTHSEPEPGEYYYIMYSETDEVSVQNQTERVDVVKGGGGQTIIEPTEPEQPETPGGNTLPGGSTIEPVSSGEVLPMWICVSIVIGIILVSAYSATPNLKNARKKFKKKEKEKKPNWKKGGPLD